MFECRISANFSVSYIGHETETSERKQLFDEN